MPWPTVSVIVPCYNEEATITLLLEAIRAQEYPLDKLEIVIADGLSTDGTREAIDAFHRAHAEPVVRLVDNPRRHIPAALNRAIATASGEIIVRLDAHSVPEPDYIARCVQALSSGLGENVGGVWRIQPGAPDLWAQAIAVAAAHPLGAGDARYRLGGEAQAVDTVPFGAFRRALVERIGGFDESLLSNEDYEFNVRVRQSGGVVWFDPAIRSTYFARTTLGALARQYWRYGYWKARMLLRYPETLRWRQLAGLFVLSWPLLGALSIRFSWARVLLLLEALAYAAALLLAGAQAAVKQRQAHLCLTLPVAIAVMHFSWGSGFLWSLVAFIGERGRARAHTTEGLAQKDE